MQAVCIALSVRVPRSLCLLLFGFLGPGGKGEFPSYSLPPWFSVPHVASLPWTRFLLDSVSSAPPILSLLSVSFIFFSPLCGAAGSGLGCASPLLLRVAGCGDEGWPRTACLWLFLFSCLLSLLFSLSLSLLFLLGLPLTPLPLPPSFCSLTCCLCRLLAWFVCFVFPFFANPCKITTGCKVLTDRHHVLVISDQVADTGFIYVGVCLITRYRK